MKIAACELRVPTDGVASLIADLFGGDCGQRTVHITLEDGTEHDVFTYYTDELRFTAEEFIGLTLEQARKLHFDRDVAWLRS